MNYPKSMNWDIRMTLMIELNGLVTTSRTTVTSGSLAG
jgi:hypothetical protein